MMVQRSKRAGRGAGAVRGLLLVGTLPPPSGGIGVHLLDVGRALASAGTPVRYADVRPGTGQSPRRTGRLLGELLLGGIRGDLVHVHTNGHNPGSWRLVRLAAAFARGKGLLTLHSGFAPAYIGGAKKSCRDACAGWARIVCVSPEIARALVETGVPGSKLCVAPAFSPFLLPRPLAPAGFGQIRRRHPVLVAATLARGAEYGAGVLLAAFSLLQRSMPSAGLVVYGPAARDPVVDAAVQTSGFAGIYRYGDLRRAEALGVVAAADVFVRPTLTDGDALSVREALALGVRTVASDAAVRPEGTVLFSTGDAPSLAAALASSLAGPPPALRPNDDPLAPVLALYRAAGLRVPAFLGGDTGTERISFTDGGVRAARGLATAEAVALAGARAEVY